MIDVTWCEDRPAISLPDKCREKGVSRPPFSLNLSESLSPSEGHVGCEAEGVVAGEVTGGHQVRPVEGLLLL